jgi:peptide/nickel transport system ATP-binding protein
MYGGKVAEYGTADEIYNHPQHPYTQRLLASFPDVNRPGSQLASIAGTPPRLTELPKGCRFAPRCDVRLAVCGEIDPPLTQPGPMHDVACHLCRGKEAPFT